MSELKHQLMMNKEHSWVFAYTKSEADKVIAELKDIDSKNRSAYYKDLSMMAKDVEHQKFKRCLAMARWCKMSARENDTRMCLPMKCTLTRHEEYLYFIGYYHKWHKRWLELAEKFKEVK